MSNKKMSLNEKNDSLYHKDISINNKENILKNKKLNDRVNLFNSNIKPLGNSKINYSKNKKLLDLMDSKLMIEQPLDRLINYINNLFNTINNNINDKFFIILKLHFINNYIHNNNDGNENNINVIKNKINEYMTRYNYENNLDTYSEYITLCENFQNFITLNEYVDNKYGLNENKEKKKDEIWYSLNFEGDIELTMDDIIKFLKIIENKYMSYDTLLDKIVENCNNTQKQNLYLRKNNPETIYLNLLLNNLADYNSNPDMYMNDYSDFENNFESNSSESDEINEYDDEHINNNSSSDDEY